MFIGLILAAGVAFAARMERALSRGGAFAAAFVGTVIFGAGGWSWAVLLLAFFVTSSLLSRLFRELGVAVQLTPEADKPVAESGVEVRHRRQSVRGAPPPVPPATGVRPT